MNRLIQIVTGNDTGLGKTKLIFASELTQIKKSLCLLR